MKFSLCKCESLNWDPPPATMYKLDNVTCACNPTTGEADRGGSLELAGQPTRPELWVPGSVLKLMWNQRDGSIVKDVYHQAWWPEFCRKRSDDCKESFGLYMQNTHKHCTQSPLTLGSHGKKAEPGLRLLLSFALSCFCVLCLVGRHCPSPCDALFKLPFGALSGWCSREVTLT